VDNFAFRSLKSLKWLPTNDNVVNFRLTLQLLFYLSLSHNLSIMPLISAAIIRFSSIIHICNLAQLMFTQCHPSSNSHSLWSIHRHYQKLITVLCLCVYIVLITCGKRTYSCVYLLDNSTSIVWIIMGYHLDSVWILFLRKIPIHRFCGELCE